MQKTHAAETKIGHGLDECLGPDLLPVDCGETATLTLAYFPASTRVPNQEYVYASLIFNRDRVLTERHVTVETWNPNARSGRAADVLAKAQAGDAVAQWELASYYWFGIQGFEKNTTRAVELWTDSCKKGVRAACANAGLPAQ
jgi:TPR repeat protein